MGHVLSNTALWENPTDNKESYKLEIVHKLIDQLESNNKTFIQCIHKIDELSVQENEIKLLRKKNIKLQNKWPAKTMIVCEELASQCETSQLKISNHQKPENKSIEATQNVKASIKHISDGSIGDTKLLKDQNKLLVSQTDTYKTIISLFVIVSVIIGGYVNILYSNQESLLRDAKSQIITLQSNNTNIVEEHASEIIALENEINEKTFQYNDINAEHTKLNTKHIELNTTYQLLQDKYEKTKNDLGDCNVDKLQYQTEKKQAHKLAQNRMIDIQKEKDRYKTCTELLQKCKLKKAQ